MNNMKICIPLNPQFVSYNRKCDAKIFHYLTLCFGTNFLVRNVTVWGYHQFTFFSIRNVCSRMLFGSKWNCPGAFLHKNLFNDQCSNFTKFVTMTQSYTDWGGYVHSLNILPHVSDCPHTQCSLVILTQIIY
jgi:hypothetical protein